MAFDLVGHPREDMNIGWRAVREEGGWRVRGSKHYITNAKEADFIVLYVKTDADAGHKGISAFMVPRGTAGISFSSPEKTMGLRGSTIYELALKSWPPAVSSRCTLKSAAARSC